MRWLWEFTKSKVKKEEHQQKSFLALNTIFWAVAVFLIGLIPTFIAISETWGALEYALIAAGYAGVFIGFLGGCVFLMRNTPE